jgi:hypothetical protein
MRKKILAAAVMTASMGMSFAALADESTTVGGKAYIDFTNLDKKVNGAKDAASGLGFDLTRFYFIVDHTFDDIWSANLTTDVTYDSGVQATQVYVKKAYFQARLSDAAVLRVGSADMPWIPYVEDAYGFRYVEKVLIDRLGFGTSADWGAHIGGKAMDGMLNYALSAVNGNGYKNPTRSKGLDFEGRVGVMPVQGLNLAAGFYNGKRGQDIQGSTATVNTASRMNVLAAYKYGIFKVGVEYFTAENWNTTAAKDKADGYSVFAAVKPAEKVAVFVRYDNAKPNKTTNPSLKDIYYNAGVAYEARKNIDLAFAYKNEQKTDNTSTKPLDSSEIGVWTQVKF